MSNSTAETTLAALRSRFAAKSFDADRKISPEDFLTLLESARLAPTAHGWEAWKAIVVEGQAKRDAVSAACYGQRQVATASHVMMLARDTRPVAEIIEDRMARVIRTENPPADKAEKMRKAQFDFAATLSPAECVNWLTAQTYIVLGFVLETAAIMGIDSCPMEGLDKRAVDLALGLADRNLATTVIVPLGYCSQDKSATRPKIRRTLEETVITM